MRKVDLTLLFSSAMMLGVFACGFAETNASPSANTSGVATLDLMKVFEGSPFIYATLIIMSVSSFVLWLYSILTLRKQELLPEEFLAKIKEEILEKRYEAALATCEKDQNFTASILATGLAARKHGPAVMVECMQAEGRRVGSALWQRISLLNDVVVIAPMLGLLGTVLGMFYAFYDTTRTQESISSIFDGLGIAVGTTVAGLIVAILAMIFYTSLKFRITQLISVVENEVMSIANIIDLNDAPKS